MKYLTKTIIIIIAGVLIVISACKKDNFEPAVSDVPCLLKKETWVGDDGDFAKTYEYNNYRRLVKIIWHEPFNWYSTIDYDSHGKISKKTHYENGEESWHKIYIWIDNFLTTIEESKKSNGEWYKSNKTIYEFNADNQIIKKQYYSNVNGEWETGIYELYTWKSENITLIEQYFNTKNHSTSFEYDDKYNAFKSLGFANVWDVKTLTKNNLIKRVTIELNGKISSTYNYNYEYNYKGFPSNIVEAIEQSGNSFNKEMILEYECN